MECSAGGASLYLYFLAGFSLSIALSITLSIAYPAGSVWKRGKASAMAFREGFTRKQQTGITYHVDAGEGTGSERRGSKKRPTISEPIHPPTAEWQNKGG